MARPGACAAPAARPPPSVHVLRTDSRRSATAAGSARPRLARPRLRSAVPTIPPLSRGCPGQQKPASGGGEPAGHDLLSAVIQCTQRRLVARSRRPACRPGFAAPWAPCAPLAPL